MFEGAPVAHPPLPHSAYAAYPHSLTTCVAHPHSRTAGVAHPHSCTGKPAH